MEKRGVNEFGATNDYLMKIEQLRCSIRFAKQNESQ